uniref:Putative ixodes 10 kDa peptide protein n=1 Tax=Ixodes ricinus TaxID=34613 RepID=A0A0K8R463_IXORI
MMIVVFAAVLMLPALQSEGFLSRTVSSNDCMELIDEGGQISCGLAGSNDIEDYDPYSCSLRCSGGANPKLPNGVCSGGEVNCTAFVKEGLRNWKQNMEKIRHEVLKKWCTCYPKD